MEQQLLQGGVTCHWENSQRRENIATGGNRSELTPARKSPRCHVNTPGGKHPHIRTHDFVVQADLLYIHRVLSEKST